MLIFCLQKAEGELQAPHPQKNCKKVGSGASKFSQIEFTSYPIPASHLEDMSPKLDTL